MKTISRQDMLQAFEAVGITPGDIVMVHADISRIGIPEGADNRDAILEGYYSALREALGPEGTLVALSTTESFARSSNPFVYETSPSEQGVLSEYIRTRPGSLRSVHPLFSLCAVGRRAADICENTSRSALGYDSPFERLGRYDARILCIGVDLLSMTYVHSVEQAYGVPYSYVKEWDAPAFKDGKPLAGRFFALVRYLESGVEYDFSRFQQRLLERGLARKARLGYGWVHAVRCRDVFNVGIESLKEDVFFFLKHPPEKEPWKNKPLPLPEKGA